MTREEAVKIIKNIYAHWPYEVIRDKSEEVWHVAETWQSNFIYQIGEHFGEIKRAAAAITIEPGYVRARLLEQSPNEWVSAGQVIFDENGNVDSIKMR